MSVFKFKSAIVACVCMGAIVGSAIAGTISPKSIVGSWFVSDNNTNLCSTWELSVTVRTGTEPSADPFDDIWEGTRVRWEDDNGAEYFACLCRTDAFVETSSRCGVTYETRIWNVRTPNMTGTDPSQRCVRVYVQATAEQLCDGSGTHWSNERRVTALPNALDDCFETIATCGSDECLGSGNEDFLCVAGPDADNDGYGDAPADYESCAERYAIKCDAGRGGAALPPEEPCCVVGCFQSTCAECDQCPDDPNKFEPGYCGCGVPDTDSDGDYIPDCIDQCPENGNRVCEAACGCDYDGENVINYITFIFDLFQPSAPPCRAETPEGDVIPLDELCLYFGIFYDLDFDEDGVFNCHDDCPLDANKAHPGFCGCQWPDDDTDGDGTYDCPCPENDLGHQQFCSEDADCGQGGQCMGNGECLVAGVCGDQCTTDANKLSPGICGCLVADVDSDGDGAYDCNETCDDDPNKTDPGVCGCGTADTDTDGDGTPDCNDGCPLDPNKLAPAFCGCGTPEGDGFTVGGAVFTNLNDPLGSGEQNVLVTLACNNFWGQVATTCDFPAGQWSFDNVPCGDCEVRFEYLSPECDESFAEVVNLVLTGNIPPIEFEVNADNDVANRNFQTLADNNYLDINDDGILSIDQNGDVGPFADCVFAPPTCISDLCRADCNQDGEITIVDDIPCGVDCYFANICDRPCDEVGPLANFFTVGGSVHTDSSNPIFSGVADVNVTVTSKNGAVRANGSTSEYGVWSVEFLPAGTYTVEIDGKASMDIEVNENNSVANRNLVWDTQNAPKSLNAAPLNLRNRISGRVR